MSLILRLVRGHNEFPAIGTPGITQWLKPEGVIYDIKSAAPAELMDARL